MPGKAEAVKRPGAPMKSSSSVALEELESQEVETEEQPDKAAIIERLKAQGAQKVLPGSSGSGTAPTAPTPPSAVESEAVEAESEQDLAHKAFLDSTQKKVDAANNPAWYNLPQKIENARYNEWDLSQSRGRSGGRERDINMEEDVRTNKNVNQMAPGLFDVRQKAKNAYADVTNNPMQTAAGMVPVFGSAIKQGLAERDDVNERDLLKGVATTESDAAVIESASSQSEALGTKITSGRVKAGISTLTGGVGKLVPGVGTVVGAAGTAANLAVDQVSSGATKKVTDMRAREKARKDMGKSEFRGYEGVEDYIAMDKMKKQLKSAGEGDEDSGAASNVTPEMLQRLKAHTRGELAHSKHYKNRAKEYQKEQEAERQKGMEPKPKQEGAGLLSKLKGLFK
jgi:hypothetical protein